MMLIDVLDQGAAGLRIALTLLAVLVLQTRARLAPDVTQETRLLNIKLNSGAWALIALAVLALSPLRAVVLFHHSVPKAAIRTAEIVAVALTCWAFIRVLGSRATLRGVSARRVLAGQRLLVGVVALSILAAGVVS